MLVLRQEGFQDLRAVFELCNLSTCERHLRYKSLGRQATNCNNVSVDLLSLFVNRIRSQHSKESVGTPLESVHCKDEKEPLHELSVDWQQWCVNRIVSSKWRTRDTQWGFCHQINRGIHGGSLSNTKDPVLEIWIFGTISYEFRWKFFRSTPLTSNSYRFSWGFPTKNGIILVVTGILGGGGSKKFFYWILLSNISQKRTSPLILPLYRGIGRFRLPTVTWAAAVLWQCRLASNGGPSKLSDVFFYGEKVVCFEVKEDWVFSPTFLFFWLKLVCQSFYPLLRPWIQRWGCVLPNEQWKIPWLFRIYRGLYYSVIWGLQKTIKIPIKKQPVQWKK